MGNEISDSSGQDAPILQAFCQTGEYYREKGDLEKAEAQLREALQLESNHLAASALMRGSKNWRKLAALTRRRPGRRW
jgi:hypothetical protein